MFDTISDLHKDARGFRPTNDWMEMFDKVSSSEQEKIFDDLIEELKEAEEDARRAEQQAIYDFDDHLAAVRREGAPDRATALRWMTQLYTFCHEQDVEHFVWEWGFLFTDEGRALVKELMDIVEMEDIQ